MKYAGVYFQPINSLSKWRDRGINVLFGCETQSGSISKDAYKKEAKRLGLKYYDVATMAEPIEAYAQDPDLLGFMLDDEPDRRIVNPAYDVWKKAASDPKRKAEADKIWGGIVSYIAGYKTLSDRIRKAGKPAFQNFAGSTVGAAYPWYKGECHKWLMPFIDELSMDFYPKTNNPDRYPNTHVGLISDLLIKWNAELGLQSKPVWTFLECSDQKLNATSRAPTTTDMEEQFQQAVARDMKGVIWFPQQIGQGFKYDAVQEPQLSKLIDISRRATGTVAADLHPDSIVVTPEPEPIPIPSAPEVSRVQELEDEVQRLRAALTQIGEIVSAQGV
jgi:hypothetical protein